MDHSGGSADTSLLPTIPTRDRRTCHIPDQVQTWSDPGGSTQGPQSRSHRKPPLVCFQSAQNVALQGGDNPTDLCKFSLRTPAVLREKKTSETKGHTRGLVPGPTGTERDSAGWLIMPRRQPGALTAAEAAPTALCPGDHCAGLKLPRTQRRRTGYTARPPRLSA